MSFPPGIEEIGTVESISKKDGGKVFEISAAFCDELKIKESVALNGACQSVINKTKKHIQCLFNARESVAHKS